MKLRDATRKKRCDVIDESERGLHVVRLAPISDGGSIPPTSIDNSL